MALGDNSMQLQVQNITASIAGKTIIKDISLQVAAGKFVGILGPNGCGKSTLLKSIYKVMKPTSGSVFLNDIDVLKSKPKIIAQNMSVVGQFNELDFDFTVYEMVLMGRMPYKKMMANNSDEDYAIVDNALAKVNLSEYATRSYSTLSGGEKQRVILARAIAQEPKFLVLDEPTNHLDIKFQLQILAIIASLKIGTLAALHDLTLAAMYCDYLYIMKQGEIVAHGEPEKILTKELIKDVYDVACEVMPHPITNKLLVTYYPPQL